MRIACLQVFSFPLAAWIRCEPELAGAPVAVAEGKGARALLSTCSPEALARGVRCGRSVAQARTVCPELTVRPRHWGLEAAAQAALCDAAETVSPRVEEGGPGIVYADCRGLGNLYDSEEALGRALQRAARRVGLEAAVGIASGRTAARIAAAGSGGVTVVPPGAQWELLAPLPIAMLQPPERVAERLRLWGIRRIGDLVALPPEQVVTRLGRDGLELVRRARGENEPPFAPRSRSLRFEEEATWEYGVDTIDALIFVLRPALERILERLRLRGLHCGSLHLSLGLEGRGREVRVVESLAPTVDLHSLLGLVRLRLEAAPPRAPVESARLAAVPARVRPVQGDLFLPPQPAPEKLALILARLGARCGSGRVGCPVRVDSHRPDGWDLAPFSPASSERASPSWSSRNASLSSRADSATRLAVRAIRPPQPLEVFCRRDRPEMVRSLPGAGGDGMRMALAGRVVELGGPWRVSGEWWGEGGGYARDYYDALLSDGAVYRIYRDLRSGEWFADGLYD